ncbi:MAG TPA: hypothetical protein VN660_13700 [Steroidobacteraceae bacterium]|nr:hypothetical protein [Steroidobacteraceae bacterium]
MSDLFLPPWLRIAQAQWTAVANTAVSQSIFTSATRTLARSGDHLKVSLTLNSAADGKYQSNPERATLRAFLARLRGQANRAYFYDKSYQPRGSFPSAELLDSTFQRAIGPWTALNSATLSCNDRVLRAKRTAAGASSGAQASAIVVSGGAYALRSFVGANLNVGGSQSIAMSLTAGAAYTLAGTAGQGYRVLCGIATGGSGATADSSSITADSSTVTADGGSAIPVSAQIQIYDASTSGVASGDYFDMPWVSLARCAQIHGAGQTGLTLQLKSLPASSSALLLPGDLVQLGSELNMVAAALDSDGSGTGYLQLYRPFRSSPADSDPLIISNPCGRFVATSNQNGWTDTPGAFSDVTLELEEALDQ